MVGWNDVGEGIQPSKNVALLWMLSKLEVSISHITDVDGQPGAAHDGGDGPPPGAGPRPLPALAGLLPDGGQLGLLHLPVRLVVVLHHQLVAEDALAALGVAQLGLGLALGRHQQTVDTVDLRLGGKSGYSFKWWGGKSQKIYNFPKIYIFQKIYIYQKNQYFKKKSIFFKKLYFSKNLYFFKISLFFKYLYLKKKNI